MTVTLIIFIGNINALHKGLYQRYKHIGCGVLGVFAEGQQPLLYFFSIPNGVHLTALAVLQLLQQRFHFGKLMGQCLNILLDKAFQLILRLTQIFDLVGNGGFKLGFFLSEVG